MNHRDVMRKLLENFSDYEIMDIYGSSSFCRDLAERYAYQGAQFVDLYGGIHFNPHFCSDRVKYIEVHPKIKIGELVINAPYRVKPEDGTRYWFFIIDHNGVYLTNFLGTLQDNIRFDAGNCFRSKDDAIAALNAIKSLLKGK